MIHLWTKKICDQIHQPMLHLAKWKSDLVSTCANASIIHEDLLGIRSFWQRHTEQMMSEWMIRINDPNLLGQTVLLRLREAQMDLCEPKPIWNIDIKKILCSSFSNNLNMNILIAAKNLNISIKTEYGEENWCLLENENNDIKIIEVLQESGWKGSLLSLRKMRIWYIGQLIDSRGRSLFTWQQLRKLSGFSAAGKKASWFKRIEDLILKSENGREIKENFYKASYNYKTTEVELKGISAKRSRKE
jgi:hypothetical protein